MKHEPEPDSGPGASLGNLSATGTTARGKREASHLVRSFRAHSLACLGAAMVTITACGETDSPEAPADVAETESPFDDIQANVSEAITTVVTVTWTTQGDDQGFVEYGPSEKLGLRTPGETTAQLQHSATLLGLKSDRDYFYRVVSASGGVSEIFSVHTGLLPQELPALSVRGAGPKGFILLPVLGVTTAILILDSDGDIVWYHTDSRNLDFYRARLSVDGESIVYNAASISGDPAEDSELVRVALDGSESNSVSVPLLAHDFVEHDDGTLAAIAVEYRTVDGAQIRGDQIIEVSPDGTQRVAWSAWDCFDPTETPGDDPEHGWTFANALDYDEASGSYLLGMRNFSSIVAIDRDSGECDWVLGYYASTFDFASGSARFLHQHQFELDGSHILVFDNEGSAGTESRVIEYELDFEANTATEIWSYTSDPVVTSFVLGEPTRLDGGERFINWGAAGQLERVTAAGESVWKVNSAAGAAFGFHTLLDSLYPNAGDDSP